MIWLHELKCRLIRISQIHLLMAFVYLTKGQLLPVDRCSDRIDWCYMPLCPSNCAPQTRCHAPGAPLRLLKRLKAHLKRQQIVTFQWLFNVLHFYARINTLCLAPSCRPPPFIAASGAACSISELTKNTRYTKSKDNNSTHLIGLLELEKPMNMIQIIIWRDFSFKTCCTHFLYNCVRYP